MLNFTEPQTVKVVAAMVGSKSHLALNKITQGEGQWVNPQPCSQHVEASLGPYLTPNCSHMHIYSCKTLWIKNLQLNVI